MNHHIQRGGFRQDAMQHAALLIPVQEDGEFATLASAALREALIERGIGDHIGADGLEEHPDIRAVLRGDHCLRVFHDSRMRHHGDQARIHVEIHRESGAGGFGEGEDAGGIIQKDAQLRMERLLIHHVGVIDIVNGQHQRDATGAQKPDEVPRLLHREVLVSEMQVNQIDPLS